MKKNIQTTVFYNDPVSVWSNYIEILSLLNSVKIAIKETDAQTDYNQRWACHFASQGR